MLITDKSNKDEILDIIHKELSRGSVDSKHPFRYVVLVTGSKQANSRYVVLREVTSHQLTIYTDSRSQKIKEIAENQKIQLLFYHPRHRTQIKINGEAKVHHQNAVSKAYWGKVQGDAQNAYNTEIAPGTPVKSIEQAHQMKNKQDEAFFCVLNVAMRNIEFLQLNKEGHLRGKLTREENDWSFQWLVP